MIYFPLTGNQLNQSSTNSSADIVKKTYLRLLEPLTNYTKSIGSTLLLKCTFESNPGKVEVTWYKNEAQLDNDDNRIEMKQKRQHKTMKTVARLKIRSIMFTDSGFYKCEGTNGIDMVESLSVVKVDGGKFKFID